MKNIGVFGIAYQHDFTMPEGTLYVPGGGEDAERFAEFVLKFQHDIKSLYLTQDSHRVLDIAHPSWWKQKNGDFVEPFTMITVNDITAGTYYPAIRPIESNEYIRKLEDQGEFQHMVWPEHCIIGSLGHTFHKSIRNAASEFERSTHRWVEIITKGSNPFTEHYGAFRANIEQAGDPSTQLSQILLNQLLSLDKLYFGGEAESHCDANSLVQLMDNVPTLISKMVILTDTMSPVPGLPQSFYDHVKTIYDRARSMGAQFAKTSDITSL